MKELATLHLCKLAASPNARLQLGLDVSLAEIAYAKLKMAVLLKVCGGK